MSKLRKTLLRTKELRTKAPVAKLTTVYKNMQLKEIKLDASSAGRKFQTITSYPIYDLATDKWLTKDDDTDVEDPIPKVTVRNSLLAAFHGNILTVIGQVDPELGGKAAPLLAKTVKASQLPFPVKLDLATNSRNHGRFLFTTGLKPGQEGNMGIGYTYFSKPEEQWKRIIYGSILNTSCRFLFWAKVKYVIVDDERVVDGKPEDDPTNKTHWGTGDSHCKIGTRLFNYFGPDRSEETEEDSDQTESKSNQLRFAVREKFCGKGTYSHNEALDAAGIDIAIPLSCLKGNRPGLGNHEDTIVFGLVHESEKRMAKASWMLWQWFKFETLEQDGIISNLTEKCAELRDAQTSVYTLTKFFAEDFKKASQSLSDAANDPDGELDYVDKGIKVILADKSKLMYSHPYVNYLFSRRLATLWKKMATGAGVRFYSVMCMPDETFAQYQKPDGRGGWSYNPKAFCSASFNPGKYIVFCNPMRHWGDCQVWENKHEGKYVDEMGVLATTRELLLSLGRDTDGDFVQLIQAEKYPTLVAEIESWDKPPKTVKFPKIAKKGTLAEVAAGSMNDLTGIVASLLGKSRALGVERVVLKIPDGRKTGEGEKEMTIIEFLSQELQIAVDSIKSAYPNNEDGLEVVREYITRLERDRKSLAAPFIGSLKDPDVYIKRPCLVDSQGKDTITRIIQIVNSNWQAQSILNESVDLSEFKTVIFNDPPYKIYDSPDARTPRPIHSTASKRCSEYSFAMREAYKLTESSKLKEAKLFKQVLETARANHDYDRENVKDAFLNTYSNWEWAQAYWDILHSTGGNGRGATSLVFNLFIDEILAELTKLRMRPTVKLPPMFFNGFMVSKYPHIWTREVTPIGENIIVVFQRDGVNITASFLADGIFYVAGPLSDGFVKQYRNNIPLGVEYPCYLFLTNHENDRINGRVSLVHERSGSDKPKGGYLISAHNTFAEALSLVRSNVGAEQLEDYVPGGPTNQIKANWVKPWQEETLKCDEPQQQRNADDGIKIITTVDPSTLETLREYLRSLKDQMELDESNYAKGRRRMWIFHRPSLRNGDTSLKKAYYDQRLWDFCQRVFPGCNVGLISYGGDGSTGTIDWHRDHTYAQPIARTVNLGEAIFGYDTNRQGGCKKEYHLKDGQVVEFNSKHPHALIKIVSEERFGINLWKLNEAKGYYPLPLP